MFALLERHSLAEQRLFYPAVEALYFRDVGRSDFNGRPFAQMLGRDEYGNHAQRFMERIFWHALITDHRGSRQRSVETLAESGVGTLSLLFDSGIPDLDDFAHANAAASNEGIVGLKVRFLQLLVETLIHVTYRPLGESSEVYGPAPSHRATNFLQAPPRRRALLELARVCREEEKTKPYGALIESLIDPVAPIEPGVLHGLLGETETRRTRSAVYALLEPEASEALDRSTLPVP